MTQMTNDDMFAILEEAALTMVDVADEQAFLLLCRGQLEAFLFQRLGDREASARIAQKFTDIIQLRHQEITRDTGANRTRQLQ